MPAMARLSSCVSPVNVCTTSGASSKAITVSLPGLVHAVDQVVGPSAWPRPGGCGRRAGRPRPCWPSGRSGSRSACRPPACSSATGRAQGGDQGQHPAQQLEQQQQVPPQPLERGVHSAGPARPSRHRNVELTGISRRRSLRKYRTSSDGTETAAASAANPGESEVGDHRSCGVHVTAFAAAISVSARPRRASIRSGRGQRRLPARSTHSNNDPAPKPYDVRRHRPRSAVHRAWRLHALASASFIVAHRIARTTVSRADGRTPRPRSAVNPTAIPTRTGSTPDHPRLRPTVIRRSAWVRCRVP